jgi:hypothetical protein
MYVRTPYRAKLAIVAALVVLGTAGCATKSISSVLADPSRYRDRQVQIAGEVVDSFGVLGRGVYRVGDGTGQMWVMSNEGVPRTGARVKVRGTVRDAFSLGPLDALPAAVGGGVLLVERSHDVE